MIRDEMMKSGGNSCRAQFNKNKRASQRFYAVLLLSLLACVLPLFGVMA